MASSSELNYSRAKNTNELSQRQNFFSILVNAVDYGYVDRREGGIQ
jgi:hypothetical protein